ncbi:MAG: hypothetical protein PHV34_20290 [Verrucomicrobiae bacterium]|nr:hypothetical protein [Verrucomicrobiae bacterium]
MVSVSHISPSTGTHSVPFWKLASRDVVTFGTLLLVTGAAFIQIFAIVGIFWSRVHFGTEFMPSVYSDFMENQAARSVNAAFDTERVMENRKNALVPVKDHVTQIVDRAAQELDMANSRERETQLVQNESERQIKRSILSSDEAWKKGAYDESIRILQSAVENSSSFLPALKALAMRYQEHGEFQKARFQWEKIAAMAPPDSPEAREARSNAQELVNRQDEIITQPAPSQTVRAEPVPPPPNRITLADIKRSNLPTENRCDLRFNLKIVLGSHGANPVMDISQAKVEVTFYDQTLSSGGNFIPMKVLTTTLQPKQAWATGEQQVLSLNYSVPRGYMKKRAQVFGDSYAFCGFTIRAFYRQQLQEVYASPKDTLETYARRAGPANE